MVYTRKLSIALGIAGAAMGLAVQPASAQTIGVEAGKWNVDYGDIRCSLSRRIAGPQSPILILSSYLGRDEPELILLRDGSDPLPRLPERVTIVLSPGTAPESARIMHGSADPARAISLQEIAEGFFDRFAAATRVSINEGGRSLISLATPGANGAVAALRACNDDLLRTWGVDIAARNHLTRQPLQTSGSISSDDYPSVAAGRDESGRVVALFEVDARGVPSNCRPVVSSGSETLDVATCRLITRRFRYDPALDSKGQATSTTVVRTLTWRLPVS